MRFASRVVVFSIPMILCLILAVRAAAQPTEFQNFDSQASAQAGGWQTANTPNPDTFVDFGFSDSSNAEGTAAGEAGGRFSRTQQEMSYYADLNIGEWTLEDPLHAEGRLFWHDVNFNGQFHVGFFDATDPVFGDFPPPHAFDHVGLEILEEDRIRTVLLTADGPSPFPFGNTGDGKGDLAQDFVIDYDPDGGGFLAGLIEVSLGDGRSSLFHLRPDQRGAGATFNAFGFTTSPRNWPFPDTNQNRIANAWIDDLTYTSNGECVTDLCANGGGDTRVIQPGDVNLDGEIGTGDIVQILGAGKFETGMTATFADGDVDGAPNPEFTIGGGAGPPGNGLVDTGDVIAILSTGLFEQGPYGLAVVGTELENVPEPSAIALLMLGGLLSLGLARRR